MNPPPQVPAERRSSLDISRKRREERLAWTRDPLDETYTVILRLDTPPEEGAGRGATLSDGGV